MAGAPTSDQIKFGILRTRDLVELYYEGRMVVSIAETTFAINVLTITPVLNQDPRRIRYEINILPQSFGNPFEAYLGSPTAVANGTAMLYGSTGFFPASITRDWRSDLEAVCLPLSLEAFSQPVNVTIRETFLTPLPVDEEP